MENIRKHYKEVFRFMQGRVMGLYWVCLLSFLGLAVMVYFQALDNPDFTAQIVGDLVASFDSKGVYDENRKISLFSLLLNNVVAAGAAVGWGAIPFIFLSIPMLAVNAIVMGLVAAYGTMQGISMVSLLAGILPHGIFEIPALMLSVALGLNLCLQTSKRIFQREGGPPLSWIFLTTFKNFALVVIPLLVLASLIETYVTVHIMNFFL